MKVTQVDTLNKIDIRKWEDFVSSHPQGNFFQSSNAFKFFQSVPFYKPTVHIVEKGGNILGSLLAINIKEQGLKGFFSRRCIVWGGPLVASVDNKEAENIVSLLFKSLNKKNEAIYTEIRNHFSTDSIKSSIEKSRYKFERHLNYIVSVEQNEDDSLKLLNSSKRRQVKKALKNGAEIKVAKTIDEVNMFYNMLLHLYRTKVKKPLPPKEFFIEFFKQKNLGEYLLIYYQDKIVGGIMCPFYKDTIYEWYIVGQDGLFKNVYPSILATWAPIAFASNNNLKYFDFLGAGKPNEDYGVREFKSKFGGQLVDYGRYKKINKPLLYRIGLFGMKVLSVVK